VGELNVEHRDSAIVRRHQARNLENPGSVPNALLRNAVTQSWIFGPLAYI